jgi:glucan phosphoethanolaminetransferase (alkaline phosphatase superfamily)
MAINYLLIDMLKKINAAQKGLITGILMIGISLSLFSTQQAVESPVQYSIYFIYLTGIAWTLLAFKKSLNEPGTFGRFFLEGFKCFIIVTLLMVIFTFVFNKMHPEFKDQVAAGYREAILKQGNSTPNEVEESVLKIKAQYLTILIARTIFAYLFLGAVITAVASFVIKRRK